MTMIKVLIIYIGVFVLPGFNTCSVMASCNTCSDTASCNTCSNTASCDTCSDTASCDTSSDTSSCDTSSDTSSCDTSSDTSSCDTSSDTSSCNTSSDTASNNLPNQNNPFCSQFIKQMGWHDPHGCCPTRFVEKCYFKLNGKLVHQVKIQNQYAHISLGKCTSKNWRCTHGYCHQKYQLRNILVADTPTYLKIGSKITNNMRYETFRLKSFCYFIEK